MSKDKEAPIIGIVLEGFSYWVGSDNVARIERQYENGEMAMVSWFAVFTGMNIEQSLQHLHSRVNGKYVVEVRYE